MEGPAAAPNTEEPGNAHPNPDRSPSGSSPSGSSSSSYSSLSSSSSSSSSVSSSITVEAHLHRSDDGSSGEAAAGNLMMVLRGCPRCFMYVIVQVQKQRCPRCKTSALVRLFEG